MTERIEPHPKSWKQAPAGSVSGNYRLQAKKRGGVYLFYRQTIIFDAPSARIAKLFAQRHAAGEKP